MKKENRYVMSETMYDELCRVLTDYEHPEDIVDEDDEPIEVDWTEELYSLCVRIQRDVSY